MCEWTEAERKRRDVSKIVQDYQDQLANVRLQMAELRVELAHLKPAIDRMRRVSELPTQWRARVHQPKHNNAARIYETKGRELQDNQCALELEKALRGE